MRILLLSASVCASVIAFRGTAEAQVHVDVPVQLTGPEGQRGVDGLGDPAGTSALITVGYAVSGAAHWATAQMSGTTIVLDIAPEVTAYRNGLLLRFTAPADVSGTLNLRAGSGTDVPLVRTDGLAPRAGEIRLGVVCEVVYTDGRFILVAPAMRNCPPGSLQVNDQFCIDANDRSGFDLFAAASHCALKGGRLCAWDEYYIACTALNAQMTSMFDDWEWVDDTANHTQTVGQVGRYTCMSQTSSSTQANQTGSTRCCYPLP